MNRSDKPRRQSGGILNKTLKVCMPKKDFTPVPLASETRVALPTFEAAYHLNRAEQTLRLWAMHDGAGPIKPLRIHGRLAWPVAEIRALLGVENEL